MLARKESPPGVPSSILQRVETSASALPWTVPPRRAAIWDVVNFILVLQDFVITLFRCFVVSLLRDYVITGLLLLLYFGILIFYFNDVMSIKLYVSL